YRGRGKSTEGGFIDDRKIRPDRVHDLVDVLDRAPFLIRFQIHITDGECRTGTGIDCVVTRNGGHSFDGFPFFQDAVRFAERLRGAGQGSPGRHGHGIGEKAVVLYRNKTVGGTVHQPYAQRGDQGKPAEGDAFSVYQVPNAADVFPGQPFKSRIECRKKALFVGGEPFLYFVSGAMGRVRVVRAVDRFQQQRAERRTQRKRGDSRYEDGRGQGIGELTVEYSRWTFHKANGKKNSGHDHGDRQNGAGYFAHGGNGRFFGPHSGPGHLLMDRFHDHDGVIYHNADGKDQSEHGQHIDGESKQLQKEEGANQGNRNGNGRNKGGAEILQEYKNNDKYQNKRFKDRILYLIDGLVDLVAYAVGDFIMDVFWKFTGKLFEYIPDTEIDFPCVGSAGLGDIQGKAGIAVHLVVAAQIGGSQFHPGYIPQVKNRSVVVGFDDNAFKLLLGGEPALVFENGFKCFIGGFPEFSRG